MKRFLLSLFTLLFIFPAFTMAQTAQSTTPRRVALVFDDGPIPSLSGAFLAVFAKENVRVTFSYVGNRVAEQPAMARAAVEAGHEVINHSNTHPQLKDLADPAIKEEVQSAQERILKATGRPALWFWAPYLHRNSRLEAAVRSAGLEYFPLEKFHLVSTSDWDSKVDAATIRKNATTNIQDKTVILCHEFREDTLTQLPAIIAELRSQGVQFLTFSELAAVERTEKGGNSKLHPASK